MDTRSLRFARRMGENYPCPKYANPIEGPQERSVLASGWFWMGSLASVLVWTGLWWLIATVLEAMK